jgi:hypothetical protein
MPTMRTIGVLMATTILLALLGGRGWADQLSWKDAVNRCAARFMDCSTGRESPCRLGGTRFDAACVERCRNDYDACLTQARQREESRDEVPGSGEAGRLQ